MITTHKNIKTESILLDEVLHVSEPVLGPGELHEGRDVGHLLVVDDQDRVRLRQVRVGGTYDDRTEILAGLRPGERIAIKRRVGTAHRLQNSAGHVHATL